MYVQMSQKNTGFGHNKVCLGVTQSLRVLYPPVPLNSQEVMGFPPIQSDSPVQF